MRWSKHWRGCGSRSSACRGWAGTTSSTTSAATRCWQRSWSTACGRCMKVELPVRDLFETSNLADLARRVAVLRQGTRAVLRRQVRPPLVPLSYPQQRLWLTAQLRTGDPAYHIPGRAVPDRRSWTSPRCTQAVTDLVRRHEPLRTVFPLLDGAPRQRVAADGRASARCCASSASPAASWTTRWRGSCAPRSTSPRTSRCARTCWPSARTSTCWPWCCTTSRRTARPWPR